MVQARRRVSYIIPPPIESIPRLQLPPHGVPRLGSTSPLLIKLDEKYEAASQVTPASTRHPRHRLGVASLAIDASTPLIGRNAPEGILYTGGRDGLVISWDLGIQMKKRDTKRMVSERESHRWEAMTGWADDSIDEEFEDGDDLPVSDGDVLGDVTSYLNQRRRKIRASGDIPPERRWEMDANAFKSGTPSHFRQCSQAHTDWVNDILLCNHNRTVVSASSDGSVKAWNPHSTVPSDPSTIGLHSDYVRCLAYCPEQHWVASGSFDRTIKLWNINRTVNPLSPEPLATLNPPDATAPKSSVYAIAADPFGRTIASGSPERVVRLWDPRSGRRTAKLVGHTDNIRSILISEDSKYLLTGSADASIKLWSLASQRCLHTFTHHTESVWSLFSSHPSLELFYSGDRSGLVCRVDVEDSLSLSDGDCIVLFQDSSDPGRPSGDGINKIIALDDNLVWTASGSSNIQRWQVPQRRAIRANALENDGDRNPHQESPRPKQLKSAVDIPSEASTRPSTSHGPLSSIAPSVKSLSSDNWVPTRDADFDEKLYGIPIRSLVKLVSANDPFTPYTSRARDPEVATLYSAASVMSVPRTNTLAMRSPVQGSFSQAHTSPPLGSRTEDVIVPANTARADYEERELAEEAIPLCTFPDDVIPGDHGLVRCIILNNRIHALAVDTSGEVAVWDIVRGICVGRFCRDDVAAASHAGSAVGGSGGERERSPREALEAVRERIEGEAVVTSWCTADTKTGVLAIHVNDRCFDAEVYADEAGFAHDRHINDETKLNIGKWVLKNLFVGFIREEQRQQHRGQSSSNTPDSILPPSIGRISTSSDLGDVSSRKRASTSPDSVRRSLTKAANHSVVICSPNMIPAIPSSFAPSIRSSPLLIPPIPIHAPRENGQSLPTIAQSPSLSSNAVTPTPQTVRSGMDTGPTTAIPIPGAKDADYFSSKAQRPTLQGAPRTPDDFSGWSGPTKNEPQTPSTPSGLIGRLKNFGGKISKRPIGDVASSPTLGTPTPNAEVRVSSEDATPEDSRTPLQILLSTPFTPPSSAEAPLHQMPPNTTIYISEEASPSFTTIYRGSVSSTHHDTRALEEAMPIWLLECLLLNKISQSTVIAKISFVLVPWNKDPDVEPLPELLNTVQSKLTSSRYLRVRKIVGHVQEKLDKVSSASRAGSVHSFEENSDTISKSSRQNAEDMYEILCNDVLLPLGITLAAVRQYVWRQNTELVMCYRRKLTQNTPVVQQTRVVL